MVLVRSTLHFRSAAKAYYWSNVRICMVTWDINVCVHASANGKRGWHSEVEADLTSIEIQVISGRLLAGIDALRNSQCAPNLCIYTSGNHLIV